MSYSMKQFHETLKISGNIFLRRTHYETFVCNTELQTKFHCVYRASELHFGVGIFTCISRINQHPKFL